MKKLLSLLSIFALVAVNISCSGDDDAPEKPETGGTVCYGKSYKGELLSGDLASGDESKYFAMETVIDVKLDSVQDSQDSFMDIVLNDVRFAEKMPVALDITLKDIPCVMSFDDNGYTVISFSAADVAPYINSEPQPVPAYMFATIHGTIQDNELQLSAKMANDLDAYVAGMEFVFNGREIIE
ncbi:MAG: hypothetical protein IKL56_01430 [Bacteroidaceae bacterium]|nr:hypothetical protein [Bacteroidaceae bacterium]